MDPTGAVLPLLSVAGGVAVDNPKLLTGDQLAEIRAGVEEGIRGPVVTKWLEWLLRDHDERLRLAQERVKD